MDRRRFLIGGAALCACPFLAAGGVCGLEGATSAAPPPGPVDAGALASYAEDGVYDALAESHGFFIVRHGRRLYAPSSICTHQGAPLTTKGTRIVCAKHGSLFTDEGDVRKGPARIPLPRFGITLDAAHHIVVNTSVTFPKQRWEEAGAYLDIEP